MQQGGNRKTEKLLMERSVPGRVGAVLPDLDVPAQPLPDNALLRDDLGRLPVLVRLARRARATIRANLVWAFGWVKTIGSARWGLIEDKRASNRFGKRCRFVMKIRIKHGANVTNQVAAFLSHADLCAAKSN